MGKDEAAKIDKAKEILRQMQEDAGNKAHLDKLKIRAQAALRRATEARNEMAFVTALEALGIDPKSDAGKRHLQGFRNLPPKV